MPSIPIEKICHRSKSRAKFFVNIVISLPKLIQILRSLKARAHRFPECNFFFSNDF